MIRARFASRWAAVTLTLAVLAPARPGAAGPARAGGRVSRFDVATRGDLLLGHLVGPSLRGEVAEWTILGGLAGRLGDWAARFFDAQALSNLINEAFPVEGQPALGPVDGLVAECAGTLGLEKPAVWVRNSPFARAYALEAGGRCHLVLTSAMLGLFEGRPAELRFVVGRELGHVLCGHEEMRRKSYAILAAVRAIDEAAVPDRYRDVLPLLAMGRLFSWSREAEFSADRAGLLCCGEPRAAYEAIMRLQHGLRAGSPWIDPDAPGFDADAALRSLRAWEYQPFVSFVSYIKGQAADHPYYSERLAMLKRWADAGARRSILARGDDDGRQLVEVVRIVAYELAPPGEAVDPYVIVSDGAGQVLRTRYAPAVRDAAWEGFSPTDPGVDQPRAHRDGQPLFFEVWDDNYFGDTLVGGFVIYPDGRDAREGEGGERTAEYTARLQWDWAEPRPVSRPGHAIVTVRFGRRAAPAGAGAAKEAGR